MRSQETHCPHRQLTDISPPVCLASCGGCWPKTANINPSIVTVTVATVLYFNAHQYRIHWEKHQRLCDFDQHRGNCANCSPADIGLSRLTLTISDVGTASGFLSSNERTEVQQVAVRGDPLFMRKRHASRSVRLKLGLCDACDTTHTQPIT